MPETLAIQNEDVPVAVVDEAYETSLLAVGGTPPYTWALVSGSLPSGVTLAADGTLAGTVPEDVGSHAVTVAVTDDAATTATASVVLVIEPADFHAVPRFQLDSRLLTILKALRQGLITPEKVTQHFFRDLVGQIEGKSLVHVDRDIFVPEWFDSADYDLREILDDLYLTSLGTVVTLDDSWGGGSVTSTPDVIPIGATPLSPDRSVLTINGKVETYGVDYTISGSNLSYLNVSGRYTLQTGDELVLRYV